MVLRKITIDTSVRFIPKTEKTKKVKAGSRPREQNKKLSQSNKKWVASGFGVLTNEYIHV